MAKKQTKKFTPKAGHPAKRAAEISARKSDEETRIEAARWKRERQKRLSELNEKSPDAQQDQQGFFANSVYVPPVGLDPVDDVAVPEYIQNKERKEKAEKKSNPRGAKAVLKKAGVLTLVIGGLGALTFSSLAPALMNQSVPQTEQQETVLVDQNGMPLDGSELPEGTLPEGVTTGEGEPIEFTVDPDEVAEENKDSATDVESEETPADEEKADDATEAEK